MDESKKATTDESDHFKIGRIHWITVGGGEIEFKIADLAKSSFSIAVHSYNFKEVNTQCYLPAAEEEVYALVRSIFDWTRDLQNDVVVPKGYSGTWTKIILIGVEDRKKEYKDINANRELKKLYDFIVNKCSLENQDSPTPAPR